MTAGKKGRRHALLYSCLRAYLAPFLSAVIPRVCLTCFTFSQPFLIETTIEYIGQSSAEADYGKALIGAYALVFVGIAVSSLAKGGVLGPIHRVVYSHQI